MCSYQDTVDYFSFDIPLDCENEEEYRVLKHIKDNLFLTDIDKEIEDYLGIK